jgi:hypothetical protein
VAEWSGQKETGEGERCWLYMPGEVHGELGQEGEREVGVRLWHWLGMAVGACQVAWAVALEASTHRLVLACLQHNGALQVLDR